MDPLTRGYVCDQLLIKVLDPVTGGMFVTTYWLKVLDPLTGDMFVTNYWFKVLDPLTGDMSVTNYWFKVLDPLTGDMSVTNVFEFTFMLKQKPPPQIIPKTYHEVCTRNLYLNENYFLFVSIFWIFFFQPRSFLSKSQRRLDLILRRPTTTKSYIFCTFLVFLIDNYFICRQWCIWPAVDTSSTARNRDPRPLYRRDSSLQNFYCNVSYIMIWARNYELQ